MSTLPTPYLNETEGVDIRHYIDPGMLLSPLYEGIDWSFEVLGAKLEIVIRDLDRFSARRDDPECLDWFERLAEGLVGLEERTGELSQIDYPFDQRNEEDFVDYLIDHSDWLMEQAEVVSEVFRDERLCIRLEGLASACFDAAREILLARPE